MAPKQKPGRSKQDYQTPPVFLEALRERIGCSDFQCDVACTPENCVGRNRLEDGLRDDWSPLGWNFCNPPYERIMPWVQKAWMETRDRGCKSAVLVPASVGANWWLNWVHGKAYVLFLNGRLTFVGETAPYPKDCAVLLYTPFTLGGYVIWSWQ